MARRSSGHALTPLRGVYSSSVQVSYISYHVLHFSSVLAKGLFCHTEGVIEVATWTTSGSHRR